jgi:hypothetical protein
MNTNKHIINNRSIYVFPEIDSIKDIAKINFDERLLDTEIKKQSVLGPNDVGSVVFDRKALNKKIKKISALRKKKEKLKNISKLLKLRYAPLDYNEMTIGQLKMGLYLDLHEMISELINIKQINVYEVNNILAKKYRRMTILVILFTCCILIYINFQILKFIS